MNQNRILRIILALASAFVIFSFGCESTSALNENSVSGEASPESICKDLLASVEETSGEETGDLAEKTASIEITDFDTAEKTYDNLYNELLKMDKFTGDNKTGDSWSATGTNNLTGDILIIQMDKEDGYYLITVKKK